MKKYILDTYCWIELFQDGPKTAQVDRILRDRGIDVCVSSITLVETSAKLHASGNGESVQAALESIAARARIVEITPAIADTAGLLWSEHHAKSNVGLADCIIAAQASSEGAVVLTGNAHFKALCKAEML